MDENHRKTCRRYDVLGDAPILKSLDDVQPNGKWYVRFWQRCGEATRIGSSPCTKKTVNKTACLRERRHGTGPDDAQPVGLAVKRRAARWAIEAAWSYSHRPRMTREITAVARELAGSIWAIAWQPRLLACGTGLPANA
jgi:hypothetical protein